MTDDKRENSAQSDADPAALRQTLVDELKGKGYITTPAVEAAFRATPRQLFLPDASLESIYRDEAIPTRFRDGLPISSSSQPAIMAIMLEQLSLEPGQCVLEIGAGTGYNAALLSHIVGPDGQVVTVDIDEDIVAEARDHLHAAGAANVTVVCGDGGLGYAAAAPYDRIILTVGAWDITPAWREQLGPDGRLLLPLSLNGPQKAVLFERSGNHLTSVSIVECGFVRLRGAFAGPEMDVPLGPEQGIHLRIEQPPPADAATIYTWLTGQSLDRPTKIAMTSQDIWRSLSLWLALHMPGYIGLHASGETTRRDIVPPLFSWISNNWPSSSTIGVVGAKGLCVLAPPADRALDTEGLAETSFEPLVRSYGLDTDLANKLIAQIAAWDSAGRPSGNTLRIKAYPAELAYTLAADDMVIAKQAHHLALSWGA
ncbi:MAG: methyltransferase, FxLD system [Chloroflexales bacterium]|nr:methyltransferase, FxLD system [Chloroflexales bacterium]